MFKVINKSYTICVARPSLQLALDHVTCAACDVAEFIKQYVTRRYAAAAREHWHHMVVGVRRARVVVVVVVVVCLFVG